jgi:hypothetical protein
MNSLGMNGSRFGDDFTALKDLTHLCIASNWQMCNFVSYFFEKTSPMRRI